VSRVSGRSALIREEFTHHLHTQTFTAWAENSSKYTELPLAVA